MNAVQTGGRALAEIANGDGLSRKERRRLRDREEILSAASGLFARHGYSGTSMQMIADAAELSVGKIYLHFEGKQSIFDEMFSHHENLMRRRMEESCRDIASPLEKIRCRLRAAIGYISENIEFLRFYRRDLAEDFVDRHRVEHERHLGELTGLLEEAVRRGEISGADPELLAAMIEGAVHHMMFIALSRDDTDFEEIPEYLDRYLLDPLEGRGRRDNSEGER